MPLDDKTILSQARQCLAIEQEALEATGWVVGGPRGAAARLGMKRTTLQFRMDKLGIRK